MQEYGRVTLDNNGSSPRVWGTWLCANSFRSKYRFIPTRVGNINASRRRICVQSVHPHACGEHLFLAASFAAFNGSSPRVWGTFVARMVTDLCYRFIPTRVGNIQNGCERNSSDAGSSPRVWGTCDSPFSSRPSSRFIPTRVGNIHQLCGGRLMASVHPHACGEHAQNQAGRRHVHRFIPTRVGNIPEG